MRTSQQYWRLAQYMYQYRQAHNYGYKRNWQELKDEERSYWYDFAKSISHMTGYSG